MPTIEVYVPPELSANQVRGLKIKLARQASKLSLEAMATKIHRSDETIRRWEKGVLCPTLDDAKAIAQVLGQPMGFLE